MVKKEKKDKENTVDRDDGTYVVKKSRKHNIIAFISCLLIAFAIWCYAKADAIRTEAEKSEDIKNLVSSNATEQEQ